jgi:tetratricopeptide (TPR) repeat protein
VKSDPSGHLQIRPATLDEGAGDDRLLRQLDWSKTTIYPLKAAQLKGLTAMMAASPQSLSFRIKLVEARTAGRQKAVFSFDASSHARRWKQVAGVADAQLWVHPFDILRSPCRTQPQAIQQRVSRMVPIEGTMGGTLWKGRMLHLKGILAGEEGAAGAYQNARPSDDDLRQDEARRTKQYLLAAQKQHSQAPPRLLAAMANQEAAEDAALAHWAKQAATYWLGLVAYERQNYADSIDYLQKRTLEVSPKGFWDGGAEYNLARAYEASGQRQQAIERHRKAESDWGSQLRAKWLAEKK